MNVISKKLVSQQEILFQPKQVRLEKEEENRKKTSRLSL